MRHILTAEGETAQIHHAKVGHGQWQEDARGKRRSHPRGAQAQDALLHANNTHLVIGFAVFIIHGERGEGKRKAIGSGHLKILNICLKSHTQAQLQKAAVGIVERTPGDGV